MLAHVSTPYSNVHCTIKIYAKDWKFLLLRFQGLVNISVGIISNILVLVIVKLHLKADGKDLVKSLAQYWVVVTHFFLKKDIVGAQQRPE